MGKVVVLGVFVADTAYRAARMPNMGETIMGTSFALGPGGKGSNQAVACARLGTETHLISKLGQDDFAKLALDTWQQAGVVAHVEQVSESYTGAAHIFTGVGALELGSTAVGYPVPAAYHSPWAVGTPQYISPQPQQPQQQWQQQQWQPALGQPVQAHARLEPAPTLPLPLLLPLPLPLPLP